MTTAILVAMAIIIAVALFFAGVFVGGNATGRKLACALRDAMERSSLSSEEKMDLLEKYQQELTK